MQQKLFLASVMAGGVVAMPWGPPEGFQGFGGPWGPPSSVAVTSLEFPSSEILPTASSSLAAPSTETSADAVVPTVSQVSVPTPDPASTTIATSSAVSSAENKVNKASASSTLVTTSKPETTDHKGSVTSQRPSATTETAASIPTASASGNSYSDIVVLHHNVHRANHSAPDVAWDSDLASTAAKIAATCVFAHSMNIDGGGYGQNIAAGTPPSNISQVVTGEFYNGEEPYFSGLYGQASPDMTNFEHWGHFSQLVWAGTTKVGCATQDCTSKGGVSSAGSDVPPYFTVCNYKGPGNYANEYAKNIGKSLGKPTIDWTYGLKTSP